MLREIKYLLLQSLWAMRQPITNALITLYFHASQDGVWNAPHKRSIADMNNLGLGTRYLPHSDRPHWPHRLHQHRHHLP